MVDAEFKTNDEATARRRGGWRPRSWWSMGYCGGRGPFSLFLGAATPAVNDLRVASRSQLTHAGGREWFAPRGSMARRIQVLSDAARRPARGMLLAHSLPQHCAIGQLTPGAHRSSHAMF